MATIPSPYYRLSIKALVLNEEQKFLLLREANGKWELPGGGLDFGEDSREGLIREIQEEMGIQVTYIARQPSYFITAYFEPRNEWKANAIYITELENLDFTPSDECQELRFFSVEEARQVPLLSNVAKFIEVFNPENHVR